MVEVLSCCSPMIQPGLPDTMLNGGMTVSGPTTVPEENIRGYVFNRHVYNYDECEVIYEYVRLILTI